MSEIPLTSDSYMIHTLQRHREILNVSYEFIIHTQAHASRLQAALILR